MRGAADGLGNDPKTTVESGEENKGPGLKAPSFLPCFQRPAPSENTIDHLQN